MPASNSTLHGWKLTEYLTLTRTAMTQLLHRCDTCCDACCNTYCGLQCYYFLLLIFFCPSGFSDQNLALDEIIVTARKINEPVQKVPQAVSVLSKKKIENTFSRDIREIEFSTPNLIIESGSSNTSSLAIRGVSLSDLEKSFDPAVGVMVDDVYLGSTSAGLLSTFDTERIEILRGPQGQGNRSMKPSLLTRSKDSRCPILPEAF
jgi:TonB-dependent Receptor Plug Domain